MAVEQNRTAVERAFDLAKSGKFETIAAVKAALSREGYFTDQIAGPILLRQLRDAMNVALSDNSDQQ